MLFETGQFLKTVLFYSSKKFLGGLDNFFNLYIIIIEKYKNNLFIGKIMQLSLYYKQEDKDLIEYVGKAAKTQRKSKASFVLSVLQDYFEKKRRLGEILRSISGLSNDQLNKALEIQQKEKKRRLLGEILLDEGFIEEKTLTESLTLQKTKAD